MLNSVLNLFVAYVTDSELVCKCGERIFRFVLCLISNFAIWSKMLKSVHIILGLRRHNWSSIGKKLEILRRFKNGEKKAHIARDLGMSESTIRNIINRKEELEKFEHITEVFGGESDLYSQFKTKTRSPAIETMERLLISWIENCNQQNIILDTPKIQAKAREFFHKVKNEQDSSAMSEAELKETFTASKGWFERFKKRTGLILHR